MDNLKDEIRDRWNIPAYVPDSVILACIQEGLSYFKQLVPGCDPDEDNVLRGLLKDYTYYSWQGMSSAFFENYKTPILTWQVNRPIETEKTDANTEQD